MQILCKKTQIQYVISFTIFIKVGTTFLFCLIYEDESEMKLVVLNLPCNTDYSSGF